MNSDLYRLLAEYPLDTLLQTIPTGLFLVDSDKTIVYWNAEAERITGFSTAEIVGQLCSCLKGDPCFKNCGLFKDEILKPQIGLTCTFQHKDGRTITLSKNVDLLRDKDGQVIGGIEAFVDISRLKLLESDLRTEVRHQTEEVQLEKAGLRAVLDGMTDPAYICDNDYQLTFTNRAMKELAGDIEEKTCYRAIYGRDSVCKDCPLPEVLSGKVVREEKTLVDIERTYEVIHSPYPLVKKPTHKLGVCRDITDRMEARRRLQQTNRELDAFVSTVSHDLRSPLTPLIGFADLLEDRYADQLDGLGIECIHEIKKTAEKMKDLLEDLLSLSRVGQLKEPDEPLDATSIAEDVLLELADRVLEHRAKVKIESLPEVKVPEPLLTDLFRNLLGNALKYAAPSNPHIEISGRVFADRIRYIVSDHGPGICQDEWEDVFEPFRRGKNSKGIPGTGIGLATVAKITRVYGGNCWVNETTGGGATFVVDFPT